MTAEGIAPDDKKIKAIRDFPLPRKVKDIQSFLGLCNYYRKFIQDFAKIAKPLYQLTKKDNKFRLTAKELNAIETLKNKLITAPVLAHFDPKAETEIRVDACDLGLGGVLLQYINEKWHSIAYISRKLTTAEDKLFNYRKRVFSVCICHQSVAFLYLGS